MRAARMRVSVLLGLVAVGLLGCGDIEVAAGPGDLCATTADCPSGLICYDSTCGVLCGSDADCRETGLGFFCDASSCSRRGEESRFYLVVEVGPDVRVERPSGTVFANLSEDVGELVLSAADSAYVGPGTPTFRWELVDDGGLELAVPDNAGAEARIGLPPVFDAVIADFVLVADDGSADAAGTARVPVTVTFENTVNDGPIVVAEVRPSEVFAEDWVELDVSGTYDPNGDDLSLPFLWTQDAGEADIALQDLSLDGSREVVGFQAPALADGTTLVFVVRIGDAHPDDPAETVERLEVVVAPAVGCVGDSECDDTDPCTADSCAGSGYCVNRVIAGCVPCGADEDCADDDPCTTGRCDLAAETCIWIGTPGCCVSDVDCSDGDPCTADACVGNTCSHTGTLGCCRADWECDDTDACTEDACVGTVCTHELANGCRQCESDRDCDDGNPCTQFDCALPATPTPGTCVYSPLPVGVLCDDPSNPLFERGGVCDARGFCRPVTRSVFPGARKGAHEGFVLNAVSSDGPSVHGALFAAGHVIETSVSPAFRDGERIDIMPIRQRGVVLKASDGELVSEVYRTPGSGSFSAMHTRLAVGSAGVLFHDLDDMWREVTFEAVTQEGGPGLSVATSARSVLGATLDDTDTRHMWVVGTVDGRSFLCADEPLPPSQEPWSCPVEQRFEGPADARGGVLAGIAYPPGWGDELTPSLQDVWYFANHPESQRYIWFANMSNAELASVWTNSPALGCSPQDGAPCAGSGAWTGAVTSWGLEGELRVWAVADDGTVAHHVDGGTWTTLDLPWGDDGTVSRAVPHWRGVAVHGRQLFGIAEVDGCVVEPCEAGLTHRALVLASYDWVTAQSNGVVVLDQLSCSPDLSVEGLLGCTDLVLGTASVNAIASREEDGMLYLWIVGSWPEHDDVLGTTVRATLYTVKLGLPGGTDGPLVR